MKNVVTITYVLIFIISISGYAQENPSARYHGIEVGSETRTFTSTINKIAYKFLISLPASYSSSTKTYPVCYVLDGQWDFSTVVSSYWNLRYDGMVPEVIIVGLTYDGVNAKYESLRAHDYTPTAAPQLQGSGGGDAYIDVLRKEVIPFIDKEYRTNKVDRSIIGTSLGGLFTYYVMLKAPELFNGYVPINPSLWWDNTKCFEYENTFAQTHKSLSARLYAVTGEFDAVDMVKKMVDQIQSHHYEGLAMQMRVLDGMGHAGSKAEGHARGLKYLYEKQPIKLSDSELKPYTGAYELSPGMQFHIVIRDGELWTTGIPNNPDMHIIATGKNEFSWMGPHRDFQFLRDQKDNVTGIKAELPSGQVVEIRKIN
jgi:predicted alpha/beta superfamily hydrolase